jgi:putative ABC transport system substrate-binding protein
LKTQHNSFAKGPNKRRANVDRLLFLNAGTPSEIDTAFDSLAHDGAGGLVVTGEAFFFFQRDQIAALAARYKVPVIYATRENFDAGGLMTYGTSAPDIYRQGGVYAGRILKGAKPADLPVQRATKIGLGINLKAAKALGITVPTSILVRADEVIE